MDKIGQVELNPNDKAQMPNKAQMNKCQIIVCQSPLVSGFEYWFDIWILTFGFSSLCFPSH
jgi:hypothetical protein